jgi:hypothetical protein
MLLGPGEARGDANAPSVAEAQWMRGALPHDIGIVDWRYDPADDFRSPSLFTQSGFGPVIGATWNATGDIASFARALAASHQRGLLQTTWIQMHHDAAARAERLPDFWAIIPAADDAWSGRATPPGRLPYDPATVYQRSY